MSNDIKTTLMIEYPDGKAEKLDLSVAILGGFINDGKHPMGAYLGEADVGKVTLAFTHGIRAFVKYCEDVLKLPPEASKPLVNICVDKATEIEQKNDRVENLTVEQHIMLKIDKSIPDRLNTLISYVKNEIEDIELRRGAGRRRPDEIVGSDNYMNTQEYLDDSLLNVVRETMVSQLSFIEIHRQKQTEG